MSRHARNAARRVRVPPGPVYEALREATPHDLDEAGNTRYTVIIYGERYRVIVARDDPHFIISFHPRRKG